MSIFGFEMSTTVMPFRYPTARGPEGPRCSVALTRVPGAPGCWVLQTRIGMPFSTAGWIIAGCSTLVPK